VEKAFGLQKEGGESQGCLIYLTVAHHVCILQFWMQVLAMELIVSKDSVLYCQITPTLPTFCLHTSASAILDGQLWSHWLQDCHFCLLCHAQSPIVKLFFLPELEVLQAITMHDRKIRFCWCFLQSVSLPEQ
jgi:hypothetical protein